MNNEKLVRKYRSQWGASPSEEGVTPLLWDVENENKEWGCGGLGGGKQGVQGTQVNILI